MIGDDTDNCDAPGGDVDGDDSWSIYLGACFCSMEKADSKIKIISLRGIFVRLMYYEDYRRHGCLVKYFTQVRIKTKMMTEAKFELIYLKSLLYLT